MYLHPNWLMIDWSGKKTSIDKVQKSIAGATPQQTKKVIQSNYKPTGSFVYDQASMMSLEDKTKQILHVGKLNI